MSTSLMTKAAPRFADRPSSEPGWKALHRAGDRLVGVLERLFADGLASFAQALSLHDVTAAAEGRIGVLTEPLLRLGVALEPVEEAILDAVRTGGRIGATLADDAVHKQATFGFDVSRPEAETYAARVAAELVTNTQDETTRTLRRIVSRGLREGRTVDRIARDIHALGPTLGLDAPRAVAADNLRGLLGAQGRSDEFINKTVGRYTDRLLRQRARTIARHETLMALGVGEQQAWGQARERGLLGAKARRVWITTPDDRICPLCAPQDALSAPLSEPYELRPPAFGSVMVPQEIHVQCRCAEAVQP